MALRRMYRRRRVGRKFTPGRIRRIPYSKGQNLSTFSHGKILHVFPSDQAGNFQMAASATTPLDLTNASGNAALLNAIPVTSGITNRVGTKVKLRTLLLNCEVSAPISSGVQATTYHYHAKLWILYDKRPRWGTAITPSISDIFENPAPFAFRSLTSRDRFDVLLEKDIFLDTYPAGSAPVACIGPGSSKRYNIRVPLNRVTSWQAGDTTGGLAAMTYGALYLCLTNNVTFASGQMPTMIYNWKISFEDMMY